jgi:hypothetical protein
VLSHPENVRHDACSVLCRKCRQEFSRLAATRPGLEETDRQSHDATITK